MPNTFLEVVNEQTILNVTESPPTEVVVQDVPTTTLQVMDSDTSIEVVPSPAFQIATTTVVNELVVTQPQVGTVAIASIGPQGIQGEQGPQGTGGDLSYMHTQAVAADEWTITHNLGKMPAVSVVDTGDSVVQGEIIYLSNNQLRLNFSAPFTGKAYLN